MSEPSHVILLVDDEPDICISLAMYLESSIRGLKCITANSGHEGLKILENRSVDLVISDFRMPGLTGLEFLRALRRDSPHIPTALFTAYPERAIAREAIHDVRVALFMQKPVEPDAVVALVQEMLHLQVDEAGGELLERVRKDMHRFML